MAGIWFYLFLLLWALGETTNDADVDEDTEKKATNVTKMAPNSKFLNPYLDDDTNLQTAIGAFEDGSKAPEENKSKNSDILLRISESLASAANLRAPKSLDDWRIISFLNSIINGNKDLKFQKI